MQRAVDHGKLHLSFKHIDHHFGGSQMLRKLKPGAECQQGYPAVIVVHYLLELNFRVVFLYLRCESEHIAEFIVCLKHSLKVLVS